MRTRRQDRKGSDFRRRLCAAAVVLAAATPLAAGPIATIERGAAGALPEGYAVLDIRDEDSCVDGALPKSRCLPAEQLLYANNGEPISFHALRWALGTLDLTGAETLVIYGGEQLPRDDILAAAALLHLNGQAQVLVLTGAAGALEDSGETRAMWRQVIYTAPMRTSEMVVVAEPAGSLRDRLRDFATGGGAVAFAAGS